ncbi:MAG: branched-chain amino acid ABC transporter permease [Candidatus Hodarchaeales archaeon]|jgi:branched-subunit amino acid ABC-type transport system permease component
MMSLIPFNIINNFALAVIFAGTLIMLTVGLNMIYSVLKFSNFAHAEFVTLGMYMAWWVLQIISSSLPQDTGFFLNNIFVHAMLAFVLVGFAGIMIDILVFNRMRGLKANATTFTVGSIGIGLIIRFSLSMTWGALPTQPTTFNVAEFPTWLPDFLRLEFYEFTIVRGHEILGSQSLRITGFQLYTVLFAIIIVLLIDYMFRFTKFGIALRATSDSMELAQVTGINTRRIVYYTWFLAAGITGFGAAFIRAEQGKFTNFDGFVWLLPIFAVAILGGVGSFRGGIIAAFIIAFARQGAVIVFSEFQRTGGLEDTLNIITFSPGYADGIGFLVLILVLLFRPQGIAGSVDATRARV